MPLKNMIQYAQDENGNRTDQKELSQTILEAKADFLKTPAAMSMFRDKITEFSEAERDERIYAYSITQRSFSAPPNQKWFDEYCLEDSHKRLKEIGKNLRRFKFRYEEARAAKHDLPPPKTSFISEVQLEQIKQEGRPEEIMGPPKRKLGARGLWLCPFHSEKTPSFYWFYNKPHYYCFGCGAHGSIIDLYMQVNKTDFKTALNYFKKCL